MGPGGPLGPDGPSLPGDPCVKQHELQHTGDLIHAIHQCLDFILASAVSPSFQNYF